MENKDTDAALSTAMEEKLKPGSFVLGPQDLTGGPVVQPYPRSPKLLRKTSTPLTPEHLSKHLEELKAEEARAEAHLQSLKKRRSNLTKSVEVMKQKVKERFDVMRAALQRDEQAVRDSLELDRRKTSAKLNEVLRDWQQHLSAVQKNISYTGNALAQQDGAVNSTDLIEELSCHKKPDAAEEHIRLNEERFQNLLRKLQQISRDLQAQLQRKTFLLDSSNVVIGRETSHSQITITGEGRSLCISSEACDPQRQLHPLQFDQVYCALAASAITAGQHYWEVDVRCCPAWAVGVAYGSLHRKGRDKGTKLGRNRMSWCVELRDGRLSAWHNDRHVAPTGIRGRDQPATVGVYVNYEKGRVAFYDAGGMELLQEFSAALTPVFDRMHHQFIDPLYPAVRFLKPQDGRGAWSSHMEIPDLQN
ncbi:tripartite motif-containing protein 72 [Sardina pilchardus]|uniref:tripartite motif-containing protein 72 n=1 Tax=Sardina pilchardus TaxID=27697 RepID=UPI002E0E2327